MMLSGFWLPTIDRGVAAQNTPVENGALSPAASSRHPEVQKVPSKNVPVSLRLKMETSPHVPPCENSTLSGLAPAGSGESVATAQASTTGESDKSDKSSARVAAKHELPASVGAAPSPSKMVTRPQSRLPAISMLSTCCPAPSDMATAPQANATLEVLPESPAA